MKDDKAREFWEEKENEFREKEAGEKEDVGADDECGAENEVGEGEESGEELEEICSVENDRAITSKAKRIKNLSIDRLSALPEALLIHILSFLGVKEAAITSVLSKRWQFLWAELPNLEFWESHTDSERIPQFVAWVDRIIAMRSGKHLEKFYLSIRYDNSLTSNIGAWIEFAIKSEAKEVTLQMNSAEHFYTLPEMLYTNSSLTKLSLGGCIMAPEREIEWKSLASLSIQDMELPQHLLDQILSACPALSMLDLSRCWGFSCLRINSPSLHKLTVDDSEEGDIGPLLEILAPHVRCLDISLYPRGRKLRLTNISSVVKAFIDLNGYDWEASFAPANVKRNAKDLLENTQHVKELELGHQCFEVLSVMVADGWQLPQSRRVSLTVTSFPDGEHNITGMIGLLESSPNLETLVVDGFEITGDENVIWQPPRRDDLNCDLLHLKTVKIKTFAEPCLGGEPMLTLARILLKRAIVLEEMLLLTDVEDTDVFVNMGLALLAYPRSSQKAVVQMP